MWRIRLVLAVFVVVMALVVVFVVLPRGGGAGGSGYETSADAWVLPSLAGQGTVELAQFRGEPVVATFFASWCTACRDELPEFLDLSRHLTTVRFVGIDSEEYGDGVQFANSLGLTTWPLARDVGGADADGLHQALTDDPGMPITAIYSPSGSVVHVQVGAESAADLTAELQQYAGVRQP